MKKVITKIKIRAEETVEPTSRVINECITELTQASQAVLPHAAALRKIKRRKRNEISAVSADPINLQDLIIPEPYQQYVPQAGVSSFFCDSGPGSDRIVIFGREDWLDHLSTLSTWYIDGTFKISPKIFSQVYVIMAKKFNGVHPIVYALLPNKQGPTYRRMFNMIKEKLLL